MSIEQQLTCELNGVKYLRYLVTLPVKSDMAKRFQDYVRSFDAIVTGVEYKREGGFLSSIDILVITFLIPENRVVEFSKSDMPK